MGNLMESIREEQRDFANTGSEWKNHILDLTSPTADPKFLFSFGGEKTIPSGELIGFKGKAKQGKSQLAYYLTSVMMGASNEDLKANRNDLRAFLFDTEQSKASLKKCVQRALKTAGLAIDRNCNRLTPFFLRPLTIDERKQVIQSAVEAEKPDVIVIDGVRDLVHDFNNLTESGELISWLLKMCADFGCTIINVLHQNKAKEDSNMRGHLGSELLNKLTDCFEVSKKDGRFLVKCTDSRNLPTSDFAFSITADGKYKEEAFQEPDKNLMEIKRVLGLCFKEQKEHSYTSLLNSYQREGMVSVSTAKRRLQEAKKMGLIQVQNEGYKLNP
jgi:hypothetical protein